MNKLAARILHSGLHASPKRSPRATPQSAGRAAIECTLQLSRHGSQGKRWTASRADGAPLAGALVYILRHAREPLPLRFCRDLQFACVIAVFSASAFAAVGVNKSFTPNSVVAGQASTLTIVLLNPNPSAATGVALTDTLPNGVRRRQPVDGRQQHLRLHGECNAWYATDRAQRRHDSRRSAAACPDSASSRSTSSRRRRTPISTPSRPVPSRRRRARMRRTRRRRWSCRSRRTSPAARPSRRPTCTATDPGSTLTITLTNPNPIPLTSAAMTDSLPAASDHHFRDAQRRDDLRRRDGDSRAPPRVIRRRSRCPAARSRRTGRAR